MRWRDFEDPTREGYTLWSPFPKDTKYFGDKPTDFTVNFRVEDLDALLRTLREEGVPVEDRIGEHEYGRFAWIRDSEGNRVELWEPPRQGPKVSESRHRRKVRRKS